MLEEQLGKEQQKNTERVSGNTQNNKQNYELSGIVGYALNN